MLNKPYRTIRVLIADDHEVYREGLRLILQKNPDIDLIGEASNGNELLHMTEVLEPDVILTDIIMPSMDGIEATRMILKKIPAARIIALSMFNQEYLVLEMLRAGAMGYLLKNAQKHEIVEAIQTVHRNRTYYCRDTALKMSRLISRSQLKEFEITSSSLLSQREIEIIKLICQDLSNKEIADKLSLSSRTVEGHRLRILEKIEARSAAGIVIYAVRNGIYKLVN